MVNEEEHEPNSEVVNRNESNTFDLASTNRTMISLLRSTEAESMSLCVNAIPLNCTV